jgi:adenylosuccinate synthase
VGIAAGAVIDAEVLAAEVAETGIDRHRLVIDPRAVLITEDDKQKEASLGKAIASTGSGNGQALSRRLLREHVTLAADSPSIARIARVEPVASLVHELIHREEDVIIEGTQGFGLSLLHGPHFPYVTAKDTTASAFAMEVGLSPRDVDDILMVIRTYPIRVGGQSGPLSDEISWQDVQRMSGAPEFEPEFTSVTRRVRRVGAFDLALVKEAVQYNKPTALAIMGLDRLDYRNREVTSLSSLTSSAAEFLDMLRTELGVPIDWLGTGFKTFDAISTRNKCGLEVINAG